MAHCQCIAQFGESFFSEQKFKGAKTAKSGRSLTTATLSQCKMAAHYFSNTTGY